MQEQQDKKAVGRQPMQVAQIPAAVDRLFKKDDRPVGRTSRVVKARPPRQKV